MRNASRTRIWPALLVVLALVLLLLPVSQKGRVSQASMDLCHGPLFAIIAAGFCWSFRHTTSSRTRAIGVWIFVALFALVTEGLQHFVGRQASWHDVLANLLGTTAGILWAETRGFAAIALGKRMLAVVLLLFAMASPIGILADAIFQGWQIPVLASFESPLELSRWSVQNCQIQRIRRNQTAGDWALQVDLAPSEYPGLAIREVPSDWTPYREFVFDVTLETPESLELIVKITDETHNWKSNDRFHYQAHLKTGRNHIRIPLSEVQVAPEGRLMDLSRMQMLQFFTVRPQKPVRLYLDNLRLVPDHPAEDAVVLEPKG